MRQVFYILGSIVMILSPLMGTLKESLDIIQLGVLFGILGNTWDL